MPNILLSILIVLFLIVFNNSEQSHANTAAHHALGLSIVPKQLVSAHFSEDVADGLELAKLFASNLLAKLIIKHYDD